MSKYITKLLFPLLFIFLFGCIKDTNGFIPNDKGSTGQTYIADVYGIILDESNTPIIGAEIRFGNKILTTDSYGVFRYKNQEINSKYNFLTISKPGYHKFAQSFRASNIATISLRISLLKLTFNHTFASDVNTTINEGNITFKMAPNSIINHSTGLEYRGDVKLSLKYLDPSDITTRKNIPGSLAAINTQKILGTLNSYGLTIVKLESPLGDNLDFSSNSTIELSLTIPSAKLNESPDEISMWVFQERSGLWIEKHKAKKIGDKYVGSVDAAGYWNFGSFTPSILINSKFVDQSNNPLSDLEIVISIVNNSDNSSMLTNAMGVFSNFIPRDELLILQVFNRNKCTPSALFTETIGPFTKDIDLGEIQVNVDDNQLIKISGQFLDCNGLPISNGHARLNNNYIYPLEDGILSLNIPMCDIETVEFTVTDRMNKKTSGPLYLESPGEFILGNTAVCQDEAYYITATSNVLEYEEIFHYDCQLNENSTTKDIVGAHYDRNNNDKRGEFIKLVFNSLNNTPLQTGAHILNTSKIMLQKNGVLKKAIILPGGKVWIDKGGNINDIIQGTYKVFVHFDEDQPGDSYTFEGKYLLPYK